VKTWKYHGRKDVFRLAYERKVVTMLLQFLEPTAGGDFSRASAATPHSEQKVQGVVAS
jgi:hypothetical protein